MRNLLLAVLFLLPGRLLPAQQQTSGDLGKRIAELESQVKQLKQELQELRALLKAPETRGDTLVMRLKYARAATMANKLREALGLKKDGPFRIVADEATNSLLVSGSEDQLKKVKALVIQLDLDDGKDEKSELKDGFEEALRLLRKVEENAIARELLRPLGQPGDLEQRLELAKSEVEMWHDRVAWSERMFRKGYITESKLTEERARLKHAEEILAGLKKGMEKKPK